MPSSLTVGELLSEREAGLDLELLAGEGGLGNAIEGPRIQKPGLALAGYTRNLHPNRVQVLGSTELSYLNQLPTEQGQQRVRELCALEICCLAITKGQEPPELLIAEADAAGTPLLRSHHKSSTFISLVTNFLEERLLPTCIMVCWWMCWALGYSCWGKVASARASVPWIWCCAAIGW